MMKNWVKKYIDKESYTKSIKNASIATSAESIISSYLYTSGNNGGIRAQVYINKQKMRI